MLALKNSSATRAAFFRSSSAITPLLIGGSSSASSSSSPLTVARRNYHEAVIDHFQRPRNVGKLDKTKRNVGSGLVGKGSCGDVIKLDLEIDEKTGRIADAKFKTFGCGSAIAASSYATETIIGKTVEEAYKLKNQDISQDLQLPPVKIHCSVLAEEAIQAALKDAKEKMAADAQQ